MSGTKSRFSPRCTRGARLLALSRERLAHVLGALEWSCVDGKYQTASFQGGARGRAGGLLDDDAMDTPFCGGFSGWADQPSGQAGHAGGLRATARPFQLSLGWLISYLPSWDPERGPHLRRCNRASSLSAA